MPDDVTPTDSATSSGPGADGTAPWTVLGELSAGLAGALGDELLGTYVHGSLVAGDFSAGRSDLDVLVVVGRPPDEAVLTAVAPVLAGLEARHPGWRGRIEVEAVARSTTEAYASGAAERSQGDAILRVSPGEALHLLPATRHRVVTWDSVRRQGRALGGPPAAEVLPAFSPAVVRRALLQHVRDWPTWVEGMTGVGGQSYAVLSTCRAWCAVVEGEQRSKRAAADRFAATHPGDADLARWARDWWYSGGRDDAAGRFDEVRDLVIRTSAAILAR